MGLLRAVARGALRAREGHLERVMGRAMDQRFRAEDLIERADDALQSDSIRRRLAGAYVGGHADDAWNKAHAREQSMRRKLSGNDRMMERFR